MRSQQHIRNNRALYQLWMFLLHSRVDVVADVAVRPAVKAAVFQRSEIIRRQIVAQFIAFVNARPQFSGHRLNRQPHGISQPRCIQPHIFSVGIANRHGCADRQLAGVDVRLRAHRQEQMLPISRKGHRARVMSARRKIHQVLFLRAALRSFRIVLEPHQLVHVSHVHVVIVKCDAERPPHSVHKHFPFVRSPRIFRVAQHEDFARSRVRQENIFVRRHRQKARHLEAARIHVDCESRRHGRKKTLRRLDSVRPIARGLRGKRRRQLRFLSVRHLRRQTSRQKQAGYTTKNSLRSHSRTSRNFNLSCPRSLAFVGCPISLFGSTNRFMRSLL